MVTVLITHLAAAESRCVKLERQLDHMRRMLRSAKADRGSLLKQQVRQSCDRNAQTLKCDNNTHPKPLWMNGFEL